MRIAQEQVPRPSISSIRLRARAGSLAFRLAQANLAARQGKVNNVKQILDEAKTKFGDQVSIRLAQAPFCCANWAMRTRSN